MNLAERLDQRAAEHPDLPAIVERGEILTFGDLAASVGRGAAHLKALGVGPGDAVLVFVPMTAKLYEVLLAVIRLGAVALFADPSSGRAHLGRCCRLLPPKAFIGVPKAHLLRLAVPELRRIPIQVSVGGWVPFATPWRASHGTAPCAAREEGDPALITFTSGSTGEPKAAVRSHGFLLAQHAVLAETLRHAPGLVDLTTLPIFGLANLASGQTTLLPDADLRRPGRIDADPVLAQIERYRPATSAASPAFFERLAEAAEARGVGLPSFRSLYTGGAPVFPSLLDRLQRLAPQAEVVAVYGSTEAEPIAELARSEMSDEDLAAMRSGRGLLAGPAVPHLSLRVIPDQWGRPIEPLDGAAFEALRLPPGRPGELVVSGGHVLGGYLHGKGDADTKFRVDGRVWHRTGDAGYLDDRGRVWLLGRCSARIRDDRGELFPFTVECAAMALPGVKRAALAAVGGKRVLAVEWKGVDSSAVRSALDWARLDEVRILDRIPMDRRHNAKVDYPEFLRRLTRP